MAGDNRMSTETEQPCAAEQLASRLQKPSPDRPAATYSASTTAQVRGPEQVAEGYAADPDFQLRGGYDNLMLDAAMPLFGLAIRLRTLDTLPHIREVHRQVRNQVENIQEEIRQRGYEAAQLLAYSYGLCLFIDEAVMERPWGQNSCWSQETLLSIFHNETFGGEKIFTVISRLLQEPERYKDVIEFMYFALCLGMKGKYAVVPKGEETLNALIHQLHGVIRTLRGPTPETVCDPYSNVAPRNVRMRRQFPWWSPLVLSALAMAVAYGVYSYRLHLMTTEVVESLNRILQQ